MLFSIFSKLIYLYLSINFLQIIHISKKIPLFFNATISCIPHLIIPIDSASSQIMFLFQFFCINKSHFRLFSMVIGTIIERIDTKEEKCSKFNYKKVMVKFLLLKMIFALLIEKLIHSHVQIVFYSMRSSL